MSSAVMISFAREGWSEEYSTRTFRLLVVFAVTYMDFTNEPCTVLRLQVWHEPPIINVSGTKRALTCRPNYVTLTASG